MLNRDRNISDGIFLDEESLRKKIVDLKRQQLSLKADEELLDQEVSSFERSTGDLKQKYNIVAAAAEIHGWDTSLVDSENATSEDKKWTEMNRKLEIQVMNEEIRKSLPSLEQEALRLEADIFAIEKAAKLAIEKQKELPVLLNKTASELEVEMGLTIENRIRLKARMQHDIETQRREKAQKVQRVGALREQLALTADEQDVLQTAAQDLQRQEKAELARIACLEGALHETKAQFDAHYGPNGWAFEAWRVAHIEAGRDPDDEHTRLPITDVAAALGRWTNRQTPPGLPDVKKHMLDLHLTGSSLDARKFVHLAAKIDTEAAQ